MASGSKSSGGIMAAMYIANVGGMTSMVAGSGTINGAIMARAEPTIRGQTMAMHALFSAASAFILPILFGLVLDLAGGELSKSAWLWAFGATAAFFVIGPVALYSLDRDESDAG